MFKLRLQCLLFCYSLNNLLLAITSVKISPDRNGHKRTFYRSTKTWGQRIGDPTHLEILLHLNIIVMKDTLTQGTQSE